MKGDHIDEHVRDSEVLLAEMIQEGNNINRIYNRDI